MPCNKEISLSLGVKYIMEYAQFNMSIKWIISALRMAIGWHFIYEGASKLFADNWSAASYLSNTYGRLSGFYHWLAADASRLAVIDYLNIIGLTLIGLALVIGLMSRWAAICGAGLLTLYYFAYPPFGLTLWNVSFENVFVVNGLMIEIIALIFLFLSKENGYGLEVIIRSKRSKTEATPLASTQGNSRREALKNLIGLPVLGLMGAGAYRDKTLYGVDVMSGATIQLNRLDINELNGELPKGKIGNIEISRLILGSNLISGYSHARDLIYTDTLFKAYNTERKVFETLAIAEQAGINTINSGMASLPPVAKYKKLTGSKLKVIAQANIPDKEIFSAVDQAIDEYGVDIVQIHGGSCDALVRDGKFDIIRQVAEHIRERGYIVGLGAHTIDSLILCEEHDIVPDYYMKTMHHDNYWSAHPRENRLPFEVIGNKSPEHNRFHENCFCSFPDRTVEFVNRVKVPVIGFKVLAAGAIRPKDGFRWAFENGADFICVGMFDFQIVDDVNICLDVLGDLDRKRKWH